MRVWLFLGALNGLIATAAGAYGWHALGNDPVFMVGVAYQAVHALALLAVAWLATRSPGARAPIVAGGAFAVGIVLFSGSVYALALTGAVPVEGAAPVGGYLMMVGWLALMWIAVRG